MRYLVVVDMQEDFVRGALGSPEAQAIVPHVVEKVKAFEGQVLFTKDTHTEAYLSTQEGRLLPIVHCVRGTAGHGIIAELEPFAHTVIEKPSFGSVELAHYLAAYGEQVESVELCGLCTDVCVISNAMLLKAHLPEVPVIVDAACSAGVSPEGHENALRAMEACQIRVCR